jgi:hypothetical protein
MTHTNRLPVCHGQGEAHPEKSSALICKALWAQGMVFEQPVRRRAVQGHTQSDLAMDALCSHPEKLCILVSQYSALILSAPCPPTEGFAEMAEFAAFLYFGIEWQRFHTSILTQ